MVISVYRVLKEFMNEKILCELSKENSFLYVKIVILRFIMVC